MKNKLLATILTLSLFTSILTIATHISPVAALNTKLYITPPVVEKDPDDFCSYFNVSVMIDDVEDLFGFDIRITWDSSLLTFHKLYNYTLDTIWDSGWFDIWPPSTGAGWVKYVALGLNPSSFSGSNGELFILEFHVEHGCNFPRETSIHFEAVKLSDSHWTEITAELIDGLYKMSATTPDLEFVVKTNKTGSWKYIEEPYEFEYCDWFEVEVNVTHICANLKDYDLKILYNDTLLDFFEVDYWGVLGDESDEAHYDDSEPGEIHVWDTGGIKVFNDGNGTLFALTFHVEFICNYEHIWRTCEEPNTLLAYVGFDLTYGHLSFEEGTILIGQIIVPVPVLNITIELIRGDVNCDGKVNIKDLHLVAIYYDIDDTDGEWNEAKKYNVKCGETTEIIDIFDLVVVASNYGHGM